MKGQHETDYGKFGIAKAPITHSLFRLSIASDTSHNQNRQCNNFDASFADIIAALIPQPATTSSPSSKASSQLVSFRNAWSDLTWMISAFIGTPTIIVLLQSVFVTHTLTDPLQNVIDAYNLVLVSIGYIIEPLIAPAINFINEVFSFNISVHPHWRPLFVLMLIPALQVVRNELIDVNASGDYPVAVNLLSVFVEFQQALLSFFVAVAFVLPGAAIAGVLPLQGDWWVQGLIAATAFSFMLIGNLIVATYEQHYIKWFERASVLTTGIAGNLGIVLRAIYSLAFPILYTVLIIPFLLRFFVVVATSPVMVIVFALLFSISAGFTFIPGLPDSGAFLFALAFLLIAYGVSGIYRGIVDKNPFGIRVGLGILGPFIGSLIVCAIDYAL